MVLILVILIGLAGVCSPVFADGTMDDTSFSLRDVFYICTIVVGFTVQFIVGRTTTAQIVRDIKRLDKAVEKNDEDDENRREKIGTITTYVKILGEKAGVKVQDL